MTANLSKLVRVLAGPTGPTGNVQGVRIFANITGPTGHHKQHGQINKAQQDAGPTGLFKSVYALTAAQFATGPTGVHKTIIISGFTGPA